MTIIEALCTIPYDYYCFNFIADIGDPDPHLYEQVTNIISGNKFDVKSIPIYNDLIKGANREDFEYFFDELFKHLKISGFVSDLHGSYDIFDFAENINRVLKTKGLDVSVDSTYAKELCCRELEKLNIGDYVIYGTLVANVIAGLLRENGLELVALVDWDDNDGGFAVIPVGLISEMQELEDKIQ